MAGSLRKSGEIGAVTVSFAERFVASEQFEGIFRDGMALVEDTAAYLDGEGRKEARALPHPINRAFATESMRLTTRLMQLASWLLIQRSVNAGELAPADALTEARKVRLTAIGRPAHNKEFEPLPKRLKELVEASYQLYDRIVKLDQMLSGTARGMSMASPVGAQVSRLEAAFKSEQIELPLGPRR
jgi:regulator of CtrA degradation